MSFYKRGNTWVYDFECGGKRFRGGLGHVSRNRAKYLHDELRTKVMQDHRDRRLGLAPSEAPLVIQTIQELTILTKRVMDAHERQLFSQTDWTLIKPMLESIHLLTGAVLEAPISHSPGAPYESTTTEEQRPPRHTHRSRGKTRKDTASDPHDDLSRSDPSREDRKAGASDQGIRVEPIHGTSPIRLEGRKILEIVGQTQDIPIPHGTIDTIAVNVINTLPALLGFTPFDVIEQSKDITHQRDKLRGIYFLIKDDQVIYVGKTINMYVRLTMHLPDKDFDRLTFLPVAEDIPLELVEACYILRFKPRLNKILPITRAKVRRELAKYISAAVVDTFIPDVCVENLSAGVSAGTSL